MSSLAGLFALMAHQKFPVEVLTPEGEVFSDEVEMISTRTTVGSIGILANHAPLLAMLDPTELRLYKTESEVVRFAQAEGYMQVAENHALILVEEAHQPSELNASELRDRLRRSSATWSPPRKTVSAGGWPSATSSGWSDSSSSPRVRRARAEPTDRSDGRRTNSGRAADLATTPRAPRTWSRPQDL